MILVRKNSDIDIGRTFLPICYVGNYNRWQGGSPCLRNRRPRTAKPVNYPSCFSPAPILTALTSTASVPTTSACANTWAKTKPSVGYIVKPAVHASANDRVHLCRIPNYPRAMLYALSNVSATDVLLKPPPTSVKSTLEPYSVCWKNRANVALISTTCNWKISKSLSKLSRWMNCTVKQSNAKIKPKLSRSPGICVNASVKKGQNVASYGFGCKKQVSARIYHWSKDAGNRFATDCFGWAVCQRQRPTVDSCRRSLALSQGHLADIWRHQTLPPQKRQRQIQASSSQATCGFAGGCGKITSRQPGQFVESLEQSSVWQKVRNRKAYSKTGHWSEDQYFSYGTTQRYDKRSTGSSDKTYSQWFSSARVAAIFDMAVAGFVQLDQSTLLVAGGNPGDGIVSDGRGLDGIEVYSVSGSCQRPSTSRLDRAA